MSASSDIAQHFAGKYEELYTSVPYDRDDMISIRNLIHDSIPFVRFDNDCVILPADVQAAIDKLKPGKSDGGIGLTSDHFINACGDLSVHIAFLFTALLVHDIVPHDLLLSTVKPIPKGKNANPAAADNYRGITLSSIFIKIFDLIILSRFSDKLCVCDLQFGFQPKRSTDMCTMLLKETIAYYNSNESPVYCAMLDATKAFDRVDYCKLFRELLKRNLPVVFTRLLLVLYTSQTTKVVWNDADSRTFSVLNGVKQGAILSPTLFCIYIDGLLCNLRDSGVGCHIGDIFVGALAYADDISLLSPTPCGMRKLLAICDNYAMEYRILFNAAKSKCLFIAPSNYRIEKFSQNPEFYVGGHRIEYTAQWPHLGHKIASNADDQDEIMHKRTELCSQINNVLCFFGKRTPMVKLKLLISYCYSFYGSVLWDLSNPGIDRFCSAWRKGLRRYLSLPFDASNEVLPGITDTLPIYDELVRRSAIFIHKCLSSDSHTVRSIANMAVFSLRMHSTLGRNAFVCCSRYGLPLSKIHLVSRQLIVRFINRKEDAETRLRVFLLRELLQIKSGLLMLSEPAFSAMDVNNMIDSVSRAL
jgi:hypothetical protein